MRSRPAEAIREGEMNLAVFIEDAGPSLAVGDEIARIWEDMFHTRNKPS